MQEENVPSSSSISEDSSSTSNMTPCPYTKSYTDYPNHFEPFFDNGADSNCANDAEFTVPQIPYPPLCREINRLSAINSNPDSFSEQNTSDFTFVSNGNSTENSAPLVYANLETVNSVYPAQERLNYSFNSASNYNSSDVLPAANLYALEEKGEEEDE